MVIECPYCSTRFRVEERRLRGHALLKCSHCTRVFPIPKTEGGATPRRDKQPRREPENLSFSFEEDDDWQDQTNAESELPVEQFILNVGPSAADQEDGEPGDLFSREVVPDDQGWVEEADDLEDALEEAEDEDVDIVAAAGDEDGGSVATTQLKSVFVFLALVVTGYALLAWTLRTNPSWTASMARSIPIVGNEVAAAQLRKSVVLEGLRGRYERTKEGKLVFVVTGRAVNQADESLANLRIQLALLDEHDQRLEQQTTICGNPVRVELIRELSIDQVAILKGIKPLEDIELQPGESCPLVSIFLNVPPGVGKFSAEVISARRQA
jgi:predicted Zn finger-like uncharacterized protein